MKMFFILMFTLSATVSCTSIRKLKMRLSDNPYQADLESPTRGKLAFSNNCTRCHGVDARGLNYSPGSKSVNPPDLIAYSKDRASQTIALHIAYGKNSDMPAFVSLLSKKEIWDISNYLKQISK